MEILYKNELGCVRFMGSGYGAWHLLEVSGLGLAPKNIETVSYYGEAGQITTSEVYAARTITLSAEIRGADREERAMRYADALKILARQGELTVRTIRERKIKARVLDVADGERHGNFKVYAIQFVCDNPYFTDEVQNEAAMYLREDLLGKDTGGSFTIGDGQVLTRRVTGGVLINDGDEECSGIMTVKAFGEGRTAVKIENATTGGAVTLNVEAGKTYAVDFDERTITDETGADAIGILDDESYLSDFYLDIGKNEIRFDFESETVSVEALFRYGKRYVSA